MDSKQTNTLIGSLVIVFDGLIGLIYYLFFFFSIPLMIFSIIMTSLGFVFLFLALAKKLPLYTHDLWMPGRFGRIETLLGGWFLGIVGSLAFILEFTLRPYFFLLMVYGLSAAGFGTYLYITRE